MLATTPSRLALTLALLVVTQVSLATKPNFILVFTDDQGWTDTSVPMIAGRPDTASPFYRTPHLERMAKRGMVFSDAYSPAPTCTPSRCSIQFGKTPARLRQTVVHDVLAKQRGIDCHDEISIAQMVKTNDPQYVTGHFGKWGFPPRSPEHAGYDESDGNTNNAHGDYLDVKRRTPLPADDPKRIFSVTKRANEFITKQTRAGRPFFLQVSHYAAHVNYFAKAESVNEQRARGPRGRFKKNDFGPPVPGQDPLLYPAMLEDLDAGLGQLLDHVHSVGIAENTYVIFTSDNGGGFRGNTPLSGGKANAWEGGLRVPMVVAGPKVLRGTHCNTPVAGWDVWATVHDLTSGGKATPDDIDGVSLLPAFEKGNAGKLRRTNDSLVFHFPWYSGIAMTAIRQGDYKLVRCLNSGESRLFNLSNDLGERENLAPTMPAKAKALDALLSNYLKQVNAETIDDMRAARRSELARYLRRDDEMIAKCQQLLKAGTSSEKENLLKKIADAKKSKARHHAGLDQLKRGELSTPW